MTKLFKVQIMTLQQSCWCQKWLWIHDLPPTIDQSWYHGQPHIYVQIMATEPMSEIENALIKKYGTKENIPPIVIIYILMGDQNIELIFCLLK